MGIYDVVETWGSGVSWQIFLPNPASNLRSARVRIPWPEVLPTPPSIPLTNENIGQSESWASGVVIKEGYHRDDRFMSAASKSIKSLIHLFLHKFLNKAVRAQSTIKWGKTKNLNSITRELHKLSVFCLKKKCWRKCILSCIQSATFRFLQANNMDIKHFNVALKNSKCPQLNLLVKMMKL